jgi:hypothetical protein
MLFGEGGVQPPPWFDTPTIVCACRDVTPRGYSRRRQTYYWAADRVPLEVVDQPGDRPPAAVPPLAHRVVPAGGIGVRKTNSATYTGSPYAVEGIKWRPRMSSSRRTFGESPPRSCRTCDAPVRGHGPRRAPCMMDRAGHNRSAPHGARMMCGMNE